MEPLGGGWRRSGDPDELELVGQETQDTSADEPSQRLAGWLLAVGTVLAFAAPIVLAATLPWSGSDTSGRTAIWLGVVGGILATIFAANLHSRRIRKSERTMAGWQNVLWVMLGIGLVALLGYLAFAIWFARESCFFDYSQECG
jgi:membrane protease YdiL (CAAX protease family)